MTKQLSKLDSFSNEPSYIEVVGVVINKPHYIKTNKESKCLAFRVKTKDGLLLNVITHKELSFYIKKDDFVLLKAEFRLSKKNLQQEEPLFNCILHSIYPLKEDRHMEMSKKQRDSKNSNTTNKVKNKNNNTSDNQTTDKSNAQSTQPIQEEPVEARNPFEDHTGVNNTVTDVTSENEQKTPPTQQPYDRQPAEEENILDSVPDFSQKAFDGIDEIDDQILMQDNGRFTIEDVQKVREG